MAESNPNPAGKPTPVKTIRVGTEMFDDVIDYVLLIRTKEKKGEEGETVLFRASSLCWAHGAMLQECAFIDHSNQHLECGGTDEPPTEE